MSPEEVTVSFTCDTPGASLASPAVLWLVRRGGRRDRTGRRFPAGEPAKVHTPGKGEIVRGQSGHRTYTRSGDACRQPPPLHPTTAIGGIHGDIGSSIGRTTVRPGGAVATAEPAASHDLDDGVHRLGAKTLPRRSGWDAAALKVSGSRSL
jgi:hypothetical protein